MVSFPAFYKVKLKSFFIFFYHGSLSHPLRFELSRAVLLEALGVRAVWGHHAVETGPSRLEALLFGFIVAVDQTHEFTHAVT